MYLCDDGHAEIVHDYRKCPLCEARAEIDDLVLKLADCQAELNEATRSAGDGNAD